MGKGIKVEIYPSTYPSKVKVWSENGHLCDLPRDVAERMGLPLYSGCVEGRMTFSPYLHPVRKALK